MGMDGPWDPMMMEEPGMTPARRAAARARQAYQNSQKASNDAWAWEARNQAKGSDYSQ